MGSGSLPPALPNLRARDQGPGSRVYRRKVGDGSETTVGGKSCSQPVLTCQGLCPISQAQPGEGSNGPPASPQAHQDPTGFLLQGAGSQDRPLRTRGLMREQVGKQGGGCEATGWTQGTRNTGSDPKGPSESVLPPPTAAATLIPSQTTACPLSRGKRCLFPSVSLVR